jgi:hypothetical protein
MELTIMGRVIDTSSRPISLAEVYTLLLIPITRTKEDEAEKKQDTAETRPENLPRTRTDEDGHFQQRHEVDFVGSVAVTCTVRADPDLIGIASAELDANQRDARLKIVLRPVGQHAESYTFGTGPVFEFGDATIDVTASPTAAPVGPPVSTDLETIIDSEFRRLLGATFDLGDTSASTTLATSLEHAFSPSVDADGNPVYVWTPTLPASITQTDEVFSGGQAVLVSHARGGLADAIRYVDALLPISTEIDLGEAQAVKLILVTLLSDLVQQFSSVPPNAVRVDEALRVIKCELREIEVKFGFEPENLKVFTEDARFTTFLMVKDYVDGLETTWRGLSEQLTRRGQLPLGARIALLKRALAGVREAVTELYRRMDTYMLGPSVRQTLSIQRDGHKSILISELFGWVADWSGDEAPKLVNGAGILGIATVRPTAKRLHALVSAAVGARVNHQGYYRTPVQRAIGDLAEVLEQVVRLTERLGPIDGAEPGDKDEVQRARVEADAYAKVTPEPQSVPEPEPVSSRPQGQSYSGAARSPKGNRPPPQSHQ